MNKTKLIYLIVFLLSISVSEAQFIKKERPEGWENLVYGGRFMDRFLPMPNLKGMTKNTWGSGAVIPRDINNGIEDNEWSYWGGNARLLDDGKYHLLVCRWAENSDKGHMEWPNSIVVHAISENSFGPYKVVQEIGKGHNPEWYITNNGNYVIAVNGGYYVSDTINGPWTYAKFDFNQRDRKIIEKLSNLTFVKREDGSFLMVCRGGGIWASKDGISTWNQLTDSSVYPPVKGHFEDPLIWKTNVQYHLIVNDWLGRIAWHMRSKDGINWKTDAGEAYLTGFSNYDNGIREDWFKYERIKVLQDKFGRATQAHFAVIDTLKKQDRSNDNHSSKQIVIPLTVGKLISIIDKKTINSKTTKIAVLIKKEEGFDPNTDIDMQSLRFGAPEKVDFGMGCKAEKIEREGDDALITFTGEGNGITDDNFAAKLLGKDNQGNLLFGYSRLPGVSYLEAALSARKPVIDSLHNRLNVAVENFGQITSLESIIYVYKKNGEENIEMGYNVIPPLKPFEKTTININTLKPLSTLDDQKYLVVIRKREE
ncbi:hypothetical protein Celal_0147 [Cellulophaga algicola DSM 14237]|uniref:Uncharacterized protein n=1 Tax=Cellulophaga algicola (strain DSM 14237 / IC166 / ACAM 630) TaxID=688270 RepID=E6X751_CELAD|nr:glycoside hydrolase family protein [Cellulophaga algicola]ADV47500.1 hypothetical protein Celal_0147 [Cellulophaga algicola DSM 14237]